MKKNCLHCKKEFAKRYNYSRKYWATQKFCSRACGYAYNIGRVPWNKGKKTGIKPWLGKKRSEMTAEKHFAWKGDGVGDTALHDWVKSRLGKPSKCEHCGTTEAKKYEWANRSHEYKRDLSDWIRLCTRCHRKYDGHQEKMWETRRNKLTYSML